MSIIFSEGFDTYITLLDKWSAVQVQFTTAPVITPGVGRGGSAAVSFAGGGVSSTTAAALLQDIGAQPTLYVGLALNWNPAQQTTGDDFTVLQFYDSGTCQCALWITPSGTLYFTKGNTPVSSGGTSLGAAGVTFPANSYHYIEVLVVINATTGVLQLRLDETTVINLTNINTKVSGNSSFDKVSVGPVAWPGGSLRGFASYAGFIDDIYFDNAQFNGDVRVNGQLPIGDGSTQQFSPVEAPWIANTVTNLQTTIIDSNSNLQRATGITGDFKTGSSVPTWNVTLGGLTTDNHVTWTNLGSVAHYKLVNETNPDGDSSYLQSNTVNQIERFLFPTIPGANVVAVIIWAFARKDDGGFRTIQGAIKSGATLGTTGTDVAPGTNYAYLMLISLTDPNTGSAWTLTAVNAAEYGIKLTN